jgi:hypothetical protein
MPMIGATRPAPSPDFGRKLAALFLGCFVDDLPTGVDRAAYVFQGGFGILAERPRSGVVLMRPLALAGSRHGQSKPGIARFAEPP